MVSLARHPLARQRESTTAPKLCDELRSSSPAPLQISATAKDQRSPPVKRNGALTFDV